MVVFDDLRRERWALPIPGRPPMLQCDQLVDRSEQMEELSPAALIGTVFGATK